MSLNITDFVFLLIEDDPNDIILVQRAFAKARLVNPLKIVRDGEEAIEYLSGAGGFGDRTAFPLPKIILLDLKLPKKSGFEVLAWLRQQQALKSTPVIVLTSSKEPQDVHRSYDLGANSYLVKPVGFEKLLDLVNTVGMYWMLLNKTPEGKQGSPYPPA